MNAKILDSLTQKPRHARPTRLTPERREELRKEREQRALEYIEKKNGKVQTNDELTHILHERLVKCCLDFINDYNIGDIERVDFCADSLQYSAEFGDWTPSTDSSLSLEGFNLNESNELVPYTINTSN